MNNNGGFTIMGDFIQNNDSDESTEPVQLNTHFSALITLLYASSEYQLKLLQIIDDVTHNYRQYMRREDRDNEASLSRHLGGFLHDCVQNVNNINRCLDTVVLTNNSIKVNQDLLTGYNRKHELPNIQKISVHMPDEILLSMLQSLQNENTLQTTWMEENTTAWQDTHIQQKINGYLSELQVMYNKMNSYTHSNNVASPAHSANNAQHRNTVHTHETDDIRIIDSPNQANRTVTSNYTNPAPDDNDSDSDTDIEPTAPEHSANAQHLIGVHTHETDNIGTAEPYNQAIHTVTSSHAHTAPIKLDSDELMDTTLDGNPLESTTYIDTYHGDGDVDMEHGVVDSSDSEFDSDTESAAPDSSNINTAATEPDFVESPKIVQSIQEYYVDLVLLIRSTVYQSEILKKLYYMCSLNIHTRPRKKIDPVTTTDRVLYFFKIGRAHV